MVSFENPILPGFYPDPSTVSYTHLVAQVAESYTGQYLRPLLEK